MFRVWGSAFRILGFGLRLTFLDFGERFQV